MAEPDLRRGDPRERTRRDLDRFERRPRTDPFWRSLALVGSVGWPIVVPAAGGAWLGHYLDQRAGSGVRFTLILLALGVVAGSVIAARTLWGDRP